jgi:hypothetical protein
VTRPIIMKDIHDFPVLQMILCVYPHSICSTNGRTFVKLGMTTKQYGFCLKKFSRDKQSELTFHTCCFILMYDCNNVQITELELLQK